jgi:hypothetical protein
MKPFNNFKSHRVSGSREQLPVGAYVAQILRAAEAQYAWGSILEIAFDIAEGEYKDFFSKDYKENQNENKKWRGTFRMNVPKGDGSERDSWTKNSFEGNIYAIEQSNPNYHWDWNEANLKGKLVGVSFRNEEWAIEGKSGWSTRPARFEVAQEVRDGSVKPMKDKALSAAKKEKAGVVEASGSADFSEIKGEAEKLPWEDEGEVPF